MLSVVIGCYRFFFKLITYKNGQTSLSTDICYRVIGFWPYSTPTQLLLASISYIYKYIFFSFYARLLGTN